MTTRKQSSNQGARQFAKVTNRRLHTHTPEKGKPA